MVALWAQAHSTLTDFISVLNHNGVTSFCLYVHAKDSWITQHYSLCLLQSHYFISTLNYYLSLPPYPNFLFHPLCMSNTLHSAFPLCSHCRGLAMNFLVPVPSLPRGEHFPCIYRFSGCLNNCVPGLHAVWPWYSWYKVFSSIKIAFFII